MGSENTSSADNQQETARTIFSRPDWVAGFVDAEGCFSVRVNKNANASRSFGWAFGFSFSVSQHERAAEVLYGLVDIFRCGTVSRKSRTSSVLVYSCTSRKSLSDYVVPYFTDHELIVKAKDFDKFATLLKYSQQGRHFTSKGFREMVNLAYSMNFEGRQRTTPLSEIVRSGSSETVRQALV